MFDELIKAAPQLGLGALFLVALVVVLREYRNLRGEMAKTVDDAVNARLGSMYGSLQIEASRAQEILDGIGKSEERIGEVMADFEARRGDLDSRFERLQQRLLQLDSATPELSDLSAFDRVMLARSGGTAADTLKLLTDVLHDPDATSQDLEIAGDTARNLRRFALAKELYEEAVERDSENDSARSELVAIRIWLHPESRDKAIREARDLLLGGRGTSNMLATVANSLMRLKRFSDLENLCKELLAIENLGRDLRAQAEREFAIALREKGESASAEDHFKRSLELRPASANTIKAFIGLLIDQRLLERARELAQVLILIDPTEHTYYMIAADIEEAENDYAAALDYYRRALEFCPSGGQQQILEEMKRKAELRIQLVNSRPSGEIGSAAQQQHAADDAARRR